MDGGRGGGGGGGGGRGAMFHSVFLACSFSLLLRL
jgi:hypothetical protein